jgi:hypothetical protein
MNSQKLPYSKCQIEKYENIIKYPYMDKDPIRYPKTYKKSSRTNPFPISNKHDIIRTNLMDLVPNIDLGYHSQAHTPDDLKIWIENAREYSRLLYSEFKQKCNQQIKRLTEIEIQKQKSTNFDITKIDILPEDIVKHIFGYLLPETKIAMYLYKYPNLDKQVLKQLNAKKVKEFQRNISINFYEELYVGPKNRYKCVLDIINKIKAKGYNYTKTSHINKITGIFEIFKTAKPRSKEDHIYFQTNALKILKTLIYFGNYYKMKTKDRKIKTNILTTNPSKT